MMSMFYCGNSSHVEIAVDWDLKLIFFSSLVTCQSLVLFHHTEQKLRESDTKIFVSFYKNISHTFSPCGQMKLTDLVTNVRRVEL